MTYWSAVWVALALVFAGLLCLTRGVTGGSTFLVGYLVEKSLSVDNLLVFPCQYLKAWFSFRCVGLKPMATGSMLWPRIDYSHGK